MLPHTIPNVLTNSNNEINANGRLAYTFDAGAYRIFEKGGNIFNYLDYGIGFKKLSGSEQINESKSIFKQRFLTGSFNLNNIWQLSDRKFIQTSIGSNLDFKLYEEGSPSPNNTDKLILAFHLKIGYGFKVKKNFIYNSNNGVPFFIVKEMGTRKIYIWDFQQQV